MSKLQFQFSITVDFDAEKAISEKGPAYQQAFKESAEEFAKELGEFLEKHPFVEGCKLKAVPS